ncbi:MAG: hypothetical protein WCX95_04870 [Candidatus Gracilibacteria bacterium]
MKKQAKILMAVLLTAVVAAGALTFVNPDLLKGEVIRTITPTGTKTSCTPGATVYDSQTKTGKYASFTDFATAVKNDKLAKCNYVFQGGEYDGAFEVDSFIAFCKNSDMSASLEQTPSVSCTQKVATDFLRVDLYENHANVNLHFDAMDKDSFAILTYKKYTPFEVRVGDND